MELRKGHIVMVLDILLCLDKLNGYAEFIFTNDIILCYCAKIIQIYLYFKI
jgi:hypothetical protein